MIKRASICDKMIDNKSSYLSVKFMMKLIIAIVQDEDSTDVIGALTEDYMHQLL